MKTIIYFILSTCVSTGALFAATNMKDPIPAFIVAFGIWPFFFWSWHRRMKKRAERRANEQLFKDYMRSRFYNDRTNK